MYAGSLSWMSTCHSAIGFQRLPRFLCALYLALGSHGRRPHRRLPAARRMQKHQQPRRGAPTEGLPEIRSRAHSGRPHLPLRPARNVAPAHPHKRAGKLDGEMSALRRHRPRAFGLLGDAAAAAHPRGDADQRRHPQPHRAHPRRSGALRAQSQACAPARARAALPHRHHDQRGPEHRRTTAVRHRTRRVRCMARVRCSIGRARDP